jgi:putative inorganic carbon (HCO3(-)) transporter
MSIPVAAFLSTAALNIVIGVCAAMLLASRTRPKLPPIHWPLAMFVAWTLLAVAFSESPRDGWPQIRKFYIFLALPLVYTAVSRLAHLRAMLLAMVGAAAASAAWSLVQFWAKYRRAQELNQDFYQAYVADRITGFMSHWMTFGGEMMIASLVLFSFLLFASYTRTWLWMGLGCGAAIGAAVLLGGTRSIWPATVIGGLYLVWCWRRKWILAVPVAAAIALVAAPAPVRQRIESVYKPGAADSNQDRVILARTGLRMVAANPWLGVGPEHVQRRFLEYLPEDLGKPPWWGHLHNIYLQYAAERGLPALAALLWLVGATLRRFLGSARRMASGDPRRFAVHAATASILGVLVGGMLEHNLGDSEVLVLFVSMIACGYAALEQEPPKEIGDAG